MQWNRHVLEHNWFGRGGCHIHTTCRIERVSVSTRVKSKVNLNLADLPSRILSAEILEAQEHVWDDDENDGDARG